MFNELIFNILKDILDSIEIILQRTEEINIADDFLENDYNLTIYDAVVMRLQVIGELIKSIQNKNQNFLKQYEQIKWMRQKCLRVPMIKLSRSNKTDRMHMKMQNKIKLKPLIFIYLIF